MKINVTDPFTWTSGISSPIYCDCRIVNSHVDARNAVTTGFADMMDSPALSNTQVIAGVASGGISYGVLLADRLKLPFIYVREERKKYGLRKQIEGDFHPANKLVLVEDLISTGKSSIKSVNVLKDEGLEVACVLSIMTYGFPEAIDHFTEAGVPCQSLCDVDTILTVATDRGLINTLDRDKVIAFKNSRADWQP